MHVTGAGVVTTGGPFGESRSTLKTSGPLRRNARTCPAGIGTMHTFLRTRTPHQGAFIGRAVSPCIETTCALT